MAAFSIPPEWNFNWKIKSGNRPSCFLIFWDIVRNNKRIIEGFIESQINSPICSDYSPINAPLMIRAGMYRDSLVSAEARAKPLSTFTVSLFSFADYRLAIRLSNYHTDYYLIVRNNCRTIVSKHRGKRNLLISHDFSAIFRPNFSRTN